MIDAKEKLLKFLQKLLIEIYFFVTSCNNQYSFILKLKVMQYFKHFRV